MITGTHFLLYSKKPDADRAFLRDALGLRGVDAGQGWLILALPPSEIAVHPGSGEFSERHAGHEMIGALMYFMCDDVHATVAELASRGVQCTEINTAPWGIKTTIPLPSGGEVGLYQPTHATAV